MKLMICGGGTGGHVYPGVAVAREFNARGVGNHTVFVGTESGLEFTIIPKEGFPLEIVRAGSWTGKSIGKKVLTLFTLPLGIIQAMGILKKHHPDFVLGVGGYVSVPLMMASLLMKYPTYLHEQNAIPGLANRLLARWVDAVFLSYPESETHFSSIRTVFTGNPVRPEFFVDLGKSSASQKGPMVLAFGGSRGASSLNRAWIEALPMLKKKAGDAYFVLQTGEREFETVKQTFVDSGMSGEVHPFIGNMPDFLGSANLVISRAGASTVAEITAAGKASVLIPYPFAANDHQTKNAESLQSAGAAVVIPDKDLNGKRLSEAVLSLLHDPDRLTGMSKAASRLGQPDAAKRIVDTWVQPGDKN